ncbi:hypothetical protein L3556_07375 [Candidatus Synechococcus calcipolaris G9]|uniref:CopG family transcriptional regulator n=1 Tax=Candidatus Synechococcus calcipolaris G9 TaxID=1497997 RepID=A0ABT6EY69_9SYNE|nr:hypothetical protein [Candidatus Synechococcus calcipolaris]MDG2990749.1 hypothetical protein [Candidatus Synechococcus calcipolaris G9]
MTSIRVTLEDQRLQTVLNRQADCLGNPREMFAEIGAYMDMKTRARISSLP